MTNEIALLGVAFEAAVIEYCVAEVRAGAAMTPDLLQKAMGAVIVRQYKLLDNAQALRAVCDGVHARLTRDGTPAKRGELSAQARSILSPVEIERFEALALKAGH